MNSRTASHSPKAHPETSLKEKKKDEQRRPREAKRGMDERGQPVVRWGGRTLRIGRLEDEKIN